MDWRRAATPWSSWACPWAASLSVWLAEHHPEIAAHRRGQPAARAARRRHLGFVQAMIDGGDEVAPGIGSDIALEGVVESAYPELPLRAALSLFAGAAEVEAELESVTCPVLLFTSPQDHVVDPVSSRALVATGQGPGRAGHPRAQLPRGHAGLRQGRDRGAHGGVRSTGVLPPRRRERRGRRPGTLQPGGRHARGQPGPARPERRRGRALHRAAAHRARRTRPTWPRSTCPTCGPRRTRSRCENVLRPDEPRPSLDRDEVLAVAPGGGGPPVPGAAHRGEAP